MGKFKTHTIEIRPLFCDTPLTGEDSKIGVITHEISHFEDIDETDDVEYGVDECKKLAIKKLKMHLENADNFENVH